MQSWFKVLCLFQVYSKATELYICIYKYSSLSRSVLIQVITECRAEFPVPHSRSLWLICLLYSSVCLWIPRSCFIPLPFFSILQWISNGTGPLYVQGSINLLLEAWVQVPVSFYQSSPPLWQPRFPGFQSGKRRMVTASIRDGMRKGFSQPGR